MSVCRSMTRPSLRPLHADSASKSSVLLSEEPSTGQNTPQNFCRGLAGLSEPMLLKKAGTSPAVDMPFLGGHWWGGGTRSSAPTSYCISLCSRRLSELRWTHYSAKRKLTNAAKKQSLCHLSDNMGTAYSLSRFTQTVWNCLLMSLNEPAASSWFHSSANEESERARERDLLSVETKILYSQQEADVSWKEIT